MKMMLTLKTTRFSMLMTVGLPIMKRMMKLRTRILSCVPNGCFQVGGDHGSKKDDWEEMSGLGDDPTQVDLSW